MRVRDAGAPKYRDLKTVSGEENDAWEFCDMTVSRSAVSLPVGSYEAARDWIGRETAPFEADVCVNEAMIKLYCALIEDDNPGYWDQDFASGVWGGILSPPGMLLTWICPIQWRPGGTRPSPLIVMTVPLPGNAIINVSTTTELHRPISVGMRIQFVDKLIGISELKDTRVGKGHFVTTAGRYSDEMGALLASTNMTAFRYSSVVS